MGQARAGIALPAAAEAAHTGLFCTVGDRQGFDLFLLHRAGASIRSRLKSLGCSVIFHKLLSSPGSRRLRQIQVPLAWADHAERQF